MITIIPDDLSHDAATLRPAASGLPPVVAPQYPATPKRAAEGQREPRIAPEQRPRAKGALSPEQVTALAILVKQAYDVLRSYDAPTVAGVTIDDWRHREIAVATQGRATGLRAAQQRDFRAIRGHFLGWLGRPADALQDALTDQPERADWELAWYRLEKKCQEMKLAFPGYPAAIAKSQFGSALNGCTAHQLAALFYTIVNRGRAKAKKEAAVVRVEATPAGDPF
jgi:hypothetical protein